MRSGRWCSLAALTLAAAGCSPEMTTESPAGPGPRGPGLGWTSPGPTVVVKPSGLNGACQTVAAPFYCYSAFPDGWLFYNDENDAGDPTLGTFVAGPGATPAGNGSVQISVSGTQRRNLASYQFAGTPLADITAWGFSTYNPSAGNGGSPTRSGYLNFNVDFDGSDSWQRRLVFLPGDNGTVLQDTWQAWDAIAGGNALWRYSGPSWPVTGEPGTSPKTWGQILADYPGVRIRVTDGHVGVRVGEPYADGYTENLDAFVFGTASGTTTFDFEPDTFWGPCPVEVTGTTYTLLADCTTDQTLAIPDGYTIDGDGHTLTGVDPAGGGFRGAIVMRDGGTAHVTRLTIDAAVTGCYGVTPTSDDRLRGILFNNAGGSITHSTVMNIRRGTGNGCQEGNAIDVRVAPFDGTHPATRAVSIRYNTITNFQKTGIVVNGDVLATITNNRVGGAGLDEVIAANGIQVAFGAGGAVNNNQVEGNDWDGASYFDATAILLYLAADVTVNSNVIGGGEEDTGTDLGIYAIYSGTVNVMNNSISRQPDDASSLSGCWASAARPGASGAEKCDPDGYGIYFYGNAGKSKAVKNRFSGWKVNFEGADLARNNVDLSAP